MSYTVRDYASMFGDRVRVDAYLKAMERAIVPGSTVLDLGTATGFFAVAACKLGARHVYGIETNDAIQVARELAIANGCSDRITLYHESSLRVELPEQVDVLVFDLRGALPLLGRGLPSIADARRRFLKPGGVQIPRRDVLWAVPVEAADTYRRLRSPWGDLHPDLDLGPIEHVLVNSWGKQRVPRAGFLAEPQSWGTLDYRTIEGGDVTGTVTFIVTRPGTGHGLQLWFDADLADGIGFSTAPMGPEAIYGTAFFPWSEPATLGVGDEITLRIDAHLVGDDYVWRWRTRVTPADRRRAFVAFDQSTFFATPVPPERLARRAASHRPTLGEEGHIDAYVLGRLAEGVLLGEIAAEVAARHPVRFPAAGEALAHVGALSSKYGR